VEIHCLGMNHESAPLEVREKLALSETGVLTALGRLACGDDEELRSISEMVVLSTCNRVEIYAVSAAHCFQDLEAFLSRITGVSRAGISPYLYRYRSEQVVAHLLRVASGLDSQVLGEPQILGQVTDAYGLARSQGTVGKVLEKLFHIAIHAGKRTHTETRISRNPASVSSQAVRLASQKVEDLRNARVVILGAGEMAELALRALRKRGVDQITVINRTLERAHELADHFQGEADTFEHLTDGIRKADVLISSTGAPHTLIHQPAVEAVLPERRGRPLVIFDIAVPRDVEGEVGDLEGVSLYDIDQLEEHLADSLLQRKQQVPVVEKILQEEARRYFEFVRLLDILPIVGQLHQTLDEIRREELERTLCRCDSLKEEDQEKIEAMSEAILKKFLHQPIQCLKEEAGGSMSADYALVTRELFGLNGSLEGFVEEKER